MCSDHNIGLTFHTLLVLVLKWCRFVRRGFSACSIESIPEQRRKRINLSRGSKYYIKELLPMHAAVTANIFGGRWQGSQRIWWKPSGHIKILLWLYRNSRFLVLIIRVDRNITAVCDSAFKLPLFYLHGCKWTLCHNRNQRAGQILYKPHDQAM